LWGVDVDTINPGTGEIDTLTGGSEQDIFVLGDQSQLYYIGSGNNDFALITDFNILEDEINVGNNQVIYTEITLNELGLGVAISSQNGDLIAFVQGANINQFITGSNPVEPPQTIDEVIPHQEEELQLPPTPTPTPDTITPTPPPTPTPTPNTPPIADNDNYNTSFESAIIVDASVGVLNGDSDGNGDPLIPILINPPANGSLNYFNADGSFSYTPNPGFSGVDSFIYVANDGELNSDIATVTIDVGDPSQPPTNTPPVADNDNYTTAFQSPLTIDAVSGILNGDSDGDGDAVSAILINPPANGNLNLNLDGSFSYTPNSGFSGVDSFIYVANDGELNSDVATVTIAVEPPLPTPTPTPNTPPNADNDNYTTAFQSPLTIDAVSGILNGDSDGDGDAVSAILINPPANGNLNLNPDGSFSYTPNVGFSGVDSFIYVANDGKDNSNIATVTIAVEPPLPTPTPTPTPNTPPVADNDNYNTAFQSALTVDASVGILNGDSDANGEALNAILVNSPANGSLNLNTDGSFSYTPNVGFSGVDSFIYVANDGKDNSNIATVTIAVEPPLPTPTPTPTPNTPPVADNDNYNTAFQSPLTVDAVSGILNGDSDGDGDPISAILVNSPANGSLNLNPDGSFSYTPNAGFSGVDSFIYVANDGELNSDVATVTIAVEPPLPTPTPTPTPNTPPVADNDNYNTAFQSPLTVDAVSGILNGDSDGDGDPISAILVNSPANGSLNLNPDGSFSYTPNAGFSGVDSFIYVANDGELNSDVATVTIAVEPPLPTPTPTPNTPPIADNDNYTTAFQSPISVDAVSGILNGDSDGDGDPISPILVNSPANGSLNLNGDGSFSYTPNAGFSGVDSFIYVANDGKDNSDVATVTIAVEPPPPPPPTPTPTPNTPPIADNDNYTTAFQSPLTIDAVSGVLNGDSDAEGEAISAILINPPVNGNLNLNPDGSFSYTPNVGFSGVDSFIYVANDGTDNSNIATVTINVAEPPPEPPTPINTTPIADNDNYNTAFQSPLTVNASAGVLNGDSDGDGDPISAILVNPPANGSVSLNGDGSFSYTPNGGFSGVDSFIYVANDGKDNSDVAIVTIDVKQTQSLNGYSQRGVDDTTIFTTFLLTNVGNSGQAIVDQTIDENGNDSNPNLGFFPEAIQDFITYDNGSGILLAGLGDAIDFDGETELFEEGTTLSFNEEGEPIFTGVDVETEITPVVDLRVRLIERDDIIAELEPIDEEGNPIVELDNLFQGEIIAYEFLESGTETILEELFLFTSEFSSLPNLSNRATNSIESIIELDLLSLTLKKPDAIKVIRGEVTPIDGRFGSGEGFVNPEG
jgi:hypothetical protein